MESDPGRVPATADGRSDSRVYSEHDSGVAPPTMTYPKLPSTPRPDTLPSDAYIEVTVDEQGLVQQVRLRSVEPTVNERMIIAAAKAWQFEPARKDGIPVKYVLRVPVSR